MSNNSEDFEYALTIRPVKNGYTLTDGEGKVTVIECRGGMLEWEDVEANVNLLWDVIDFFGLSNNKFAKEQISVHVEAGRKYELKDGEKWEKECYDTVVDK